MVDPKPEDSEEKPLDPAVARVQARLQRLMLIAGLTLGLGILAVFLAIIYRITASDDKTAVAIHSEPSSAAAVPATPEPAAPAEAESSPPAEPASLPETDPEATAATGPAGQDPGREAPEGEAQGANATEPASPTSAGSPPIPVPSPRLPPLDAPGGIETGSVPPETDAAVLATKASVPADARLVASTVAGGRIVLTYDHFNGTILLVVDPETLKVVGRLEVQPQ